MARDQIRDQILRADPSLRVRDIVSPTILARLPPSICSAFASMRVVWANNRAWGLSFSLGDASVTVGHRRGDHVSGLPEAHGISRRTASEYLRKQVEGTLLHELGHAIIDATPREAIAAAQSVTRGQPPPSTYEGHDVEAMSEFDLFHERMAESIRWWLAAPQLVETQWPAWGRAARVFVREAARAQLH